MAGFLEKNCLLSSNMYSFRRSIGTMKCLSSIIGPIYEVFCNIEFLFATFVNIKGAFDSIDISALILELSSFHIPNSVSNLIFVYLTSSSILLFFCLHSWIITYTGFLQGSFLSPLLFNVYINPICNSLISPSIHSLFYADDIVIFTSNKYFDLSVNTLNNSLRKLSFSLLFCFYVTWFLITYVIITFPTFF